MQALTAQQILHVWEIGQFQHPLDRALTLLSFALPELTTVELVQLSIGQRDAYLLKLRELTLGAELDSYAECPRCRTPLEFTVNASDLCMATPEPGSGIEYSLTAEGFELCFSLPTSQDLAAVVSCPDLGTAHQLLVQRCVRQATRSGEQVAAIELPATVIQQLSDQIAVQDPQTEILLDLTCPACGHFWQVLFDIVSFFWTELNAQAKRLLREVHTLARFYGWQEADILAMSPTRRQIYLEMVG